MTLTHESGFNLITSLQTSPQQKYKITFDLFAADYVTITRFPQTNHAGESARFPVCGLNFVIINVLHEDISCTESGFMRDSA
ncbi:MULTISPECIES: hypothetical protein [Pantoea]|uniref:hypothetical protein n=1 Tax=Pantoea TaxID=53335 RepID=UPI001980300D|nr:MULTISPECIES: hypothetical protein [Pantoea]